MESNSLPPPPPKKKKELIMSTKNSLIHILQKVLETFRDSEMFYRKQLFSAWALHYQKNS